MVLHEGRKVTVNLGSIREVRLEAFIGGGGFGEVYRARDLKTEKLYAFKHIRIKPTHSRTEKKERIQRIKNEAEVRIPSKYVVPVIGLSEFAENNFAILFSFVENAVDLDEWMKHHSGSSWERKKAVFLKILEGVHDAHAVNVIHRDLKPGNVLIDESETPQIIDFGIAKFKDKAVTETGDLLGTMPYFDPHALLNGSKYVDARFDIYALGVLLHQLVAGVHFWRTCGLDFQQFVRIVLNGTSNIMEIEKVGDSFEGDSVLREVIARATMFDPEKRPASVNALRQLLGEAPLRREYSLKAGMPASPVLIVEDGSARGAMNLITVADGSARELNRRNLDATNNTISRRSHAFITRKGDRYFLHDGGSSNGTFLNGARLKPGVEYSREIRHADCIRFADLWTRFVFLNQPDA